MKSLILFHIENQPLQVLPLRMIDVDRMVGWLMQLVQDAHLAPRLSGSRKDGVSEIILGDHLGTTECEEYSTGLNHLQSLLVQPRIALQRIVQGPSVLGKGGRVEDDQVILVAGMLQILEGVFAERLMALVAWKIEGHVAIRQFYRLLTAVYRVYQTGTSPHGIE